jgi:transglutaminase-like putative cysteine protease
MEVSIGTMKLRIARADRTRAMQLDKLPELFTSTFIQTNRRIVRNTPKLALRLRSTEGRLSDLPKTTMQRPRRIDPRTIELTVTRPDWGPIRNPLKRLARIPADIQREFLVASPFIDIENPRIAALAKKARGNARTPAELADRLRRFVGDYIKRKDLGVGFATASEVAQTRQGDCTEHGVLLAALARANGLPARVVAGLILIPGRRDAFGYHMWTQVWIDGRWWDIDAAMDQTDCDATHIALSASSLGGGGLLEDSLAIATIIGRLKIEVMSGGEPPTDGD